MRKITLIALSFVTICSSLLMSCGGDDDHDYIMYDLRTLSYVREDFTPVTKNRVPVNRRQLRGHGSVLSGQYVMKRANSALAQSSSRRYTYEYGKNAHLYWTEATCKDKDKDDHGNILLTANQTLDGDGFPVRRIWHDDKGVFVDAYDYTYDKSLYLINSYIHYNNDPTDNPDATKSYEYSNEWDGQGIFITQTAVSYDLTGIKVYEEKVRSVIQENVLRGSGGIVYWEYYREYDGGELTYQEKGTFDPYGYPKDLNVDSNGDGTYDQTYHFETTKTIEGYLESVVKVKIEDGTETKLWKEMYVYDGDGLLKTWEWWHDVSGDQFELTAIYTFVWYENPVNGPTGGEYVDFESDKDGNPISDYTTINWTDRQKVYHYYSSPGNESRRDLYNLEKIELRRGG